MILVTGLIALAMMTVPGFPVVVFLLLGSLFVGMGLWRFRHSVRFLGKLFRVPDSKDLLPLDVVASDELSTPAALLIEMGHADAAPARPEQRAHGHARNGGPAARRVRGAVAGHRLCARGQGLPPNTYRVFAHGVRIGSGRLQPGAQFLPASRADRLALPSPAGHADEQTYLPAFPPANGAKRTRAPRTVRSVRWTCCADICAMPWSST